MLNVTAVNQTRANLVTVPIGVSGQVRLYTLTGTHLVVDVTGYYLDQPGPTSAGRTIVVSPQRIFDSRETEPAPGPRGRIPNGGTIEITAIGHGSVPNNAAAIIATVTATEASAPGFVTAYPAGTPRPETSNLDLDTFNATAAGQIMVPIGDNGNIMLYTLANR